MISYTCVSLQDQLLFCDDCDRGYHMYCLTPPIKEPPEGAIVHAPSTQHTQYNAIHLLPLLCRELELWHVQEMTA